MNKIFISAILTAAVFNLSAFAAEFEQDKEYIACRKETAGESGLVKCQEELLERLNIELAKTLEKNLSKQSEADKDKAHHYQFQWESWRQGHCDYSLRDREDQQLLGLACYLQATQDRLDMLRGKQLESSQNFDVCLRRAGKIESQEILCRQERFRQVSQRLEFYREETLKRNPDRNALFKEDADWQTQRRAKCGRSDTFSSIEQAAAHYECITKETEKRIEEPLH